VPKARQKCIATSPYVPLQKANKLIIDDAKGVEELVHRMSHKQMMLTKISLKGQ